MTNLKLKDVLNCGKQSNIVATCEKQWSGMLKSLRISLLQIPSEQDSCCSVAKSRLTLQPHGLQHTRFPCPSLSPRVCSDSCPLTWWCYLTISSSASPFSSCPQSFPASVFSNELALHIRWPKYWNFSISPCNEYSGLISFRLTGLISLLCKELAGVFSSTTVRKRQFFSI